MSRSCHRHRCPNLVWRGVSTAAEGSCYSLALFSIRKVLTRLLHSYIPARSRQHAKDRAHRAYLGRYLVHFRASASPRSLMWSMNSRDMLSTHDAHCKSSTTTSWRTRYTSLRPAWGKPTSEDGLALQKFHNFCADAPANQNFVEVKW